MLTCLRYVAVCFAVGAVGCASSDAANPAHGASIGVDDAIASEPDDAAMSSEDSPALPDDGAPTPTVEIGVPGGPDGLTFEPLSSGAELRLQSFGQGGTHVLLAIRCIGFGNRAFVTLSLTNELTAAIAESPPPARPQLLFCGDGGVCDLVPILAMASGLTELGAERNGLPVLITANVRNQTGSSASASQHVVLSTADL